MDLGDVRGWRLVKGRDQGPVKGAGRGREAVTTVRGTLIN